MRPVYFVDTTLRDGQMSLWASGMRTDMMLPVAPFIDRAGYLAVEVIAPAFLKKCVRELREDPWQRIGLLSERIIQTPLRAITNRYLRSFQITPRSIRQLWMTCLAARGVKEVRLSDPSNTVATWQEQVEDAKNAGLVPIINLIFSVSPKHTDEYYADKAREAAKLGPARICIKDPSGLLTPERTRTLVPAVLNNVGQVPVEFHTHCTTGLGPLCSLEAAQLGIDIINVAIPPLANGSSNPSVFNVARNLRALGFTVQIKEDVVKAASEHLFEVAKREGLPAGQPAEYDCAYYQHQVPGGMISNLRYQLAKLGRQDLLEAVLDEVVRVRAELGYPIMVTPYSQFVGVQATMNVIVGERYKEVPDEIIQYALGFWGEEEARAIDSDVKDRILSHPRAKDWVGWRPEEPSIDELRRQLGGPGITDEMVVLRFVAGDDALDLGQSTKQQHGTLRVHSPLVELIQEICKRTDYRKVYIRRDGITLRLEQGLPT